MQAATTTDSSNLLLQDIDYQWTDTPWGSWRRYMYANGTMFAEFTSHAQAGRIPVVHITWGKCPETGRRIPAVGLIAIGRRATGAIAIGQMAVGLVAIGQLALGVVFGLGQASSGVVAIGQAALAAVLGIGQFAYSGYITIAQMGVGQYVLAQMGYGQHVIDSRGVDLVAKEFFQQLLGL